MRLALNLRQHWGGVSVQAFAKQSSHTCFGTCANSFVGKVPVLLRAEHRQVRRRWFQVNHLHHVCVANPRGTHVFKNTNLEIRNV
jgi:hypothetical protein